jgi:hypothetical protein
MRNVQRMDFMDWYAGLGLLLGAGAVVVLLVWALLDFFGLLRR